MVKLLMHAGRCAGRYLALAALTTTLVACGGSSGDTDTSVDDTDADGDGLVDSLDPFVDLDGDGLDDLTGLPDPDIEEPIVFTPVSAENPCGGDQVGTDNSSADADWGNNCLINTVDGLGDGQFATSLYAAGVQRVAFCAGFGGVAGQTYTEFADGIYGPNSEEAVKQFQASDPNPLTDDGEVGPNTWGKLQDALELLAQGQQEAGGSPDVQDAYGFSEGRCAGETLFYQDMMFDTAAQNFVAGGWSLARNTPNTAETAPFSIDPPGGQL